MSCGRKIGISRRDVGDKSSLIALSEQLKGVVDAVLHGINNARMASIKQRLSVLSR